MAPTPQQRIDFARRFVLLRKGSGKTQAMVAALLQAHDGDPVSAAAISEYERGVSAPSSRNALALERIFDEPEGSLAGLLGYRGDDPSTSAELSALRREVAELRALVERLGTPADAPQPEGAEP